MTTTTMISMRVNPEACLGRGREEARNIFLGPRAEPVRVWPRPQQ